jgi:hypothetical protein
MGWRAFYDDRGLLRSFGVHAFFGRVRVRDDGLVRAEAARPVDLIVAAEAAPVAEAVELAATYRVPVRAVADVDIAERWSESVGVWFPAWRGDVAHVLT